MNTLLEITKETLEKNKANDVVVVDFDNQNPLVDHFVIADAPSVRQINALADYVIEALETNELPIKHIERERNSSWILIDAFDIVIHIFLTEDRHHYNLEKLYQDLIR